MLNINPQDIIDQLVLMRGQLIALGICLALAIVVTVAVMKLPKSTKKLARGSAWMAFVVALVIVINLILTGPLYNVVNLALGGEGGEISEESITSASRLGEEISEEGFVLLKNDGLLPLGSGAQLNTFGWSSSSPVYGGTGSGSLSGLYETVSLLNGLENAGIQYNQDLAELYTGWRTGRPIVGMTGQDWTVPEPTMAEYDAAGVFESAAAYSDTAMIVIARSGGESADLATSLDDVNTYAEGGPFGATGVRKSEYADDLDASKHYLELSNREQAMVERVTSEFANVIVVVNAANTLELGWVEDYPSIKAVILAPGPGQTGFNALGRILTGEVNPSGKTVDTFVYDLTATPYFNNIGDFEYTNVPQYQVEATVFADATQPNFVNYVENIYVGYKFYETAAAEGLIDYDSVVQYPFGYGLSYTTFSQKMGSISESNGTISFDVTVTNTGGTAGKDVVEVYYNPPYTNGGIEKASANLVAFAKTGVIDPGKSETVKISFKAEEMASFDTHSAGAYVLESGDYIISINSDSHHVLDSQTYSVWPGLGIGRPASGSPPGPPKSR